MPSKIIIDGRCDSACVFLLLFKRVCYTRKAFFHGHGVFNGVGREKIYNPGLTKFYKDQFPRQLRRYFTGPVQYIPKWKIDKYMGNKRCGATA